MNAWLAAGGPVERARQARWSLERQVRFVAGALVLVALLAGIAVPALNYVAGAVGAGLAALTDICVMGDAARAAAPQPRPRR